MNNTPQWRYRIIRLLIAGLRLGFVAAVMVMTVPMIAYTQTTEPVIESRPSGYD